MEIFISWSGSRSRQVANALASWLKEVFQAAPLTIFVSTQDIRAGAKWNETINEALRKSEFGILCLTPENLNAPWILFEGGALSKTAGEGSVCPYLYDLRKSDLRRPLEQFNAVDADEEGTKNLVFLINKLLAKKQLPEYLLEAFFNKEWSKLVEQFARIPSVNSDVHIAIGRLQQEIPNILSQVKDRRRFIENDYFAQVILNTVGHLKVALLESKTYFDVPITLYPFHLITLLNQFKPVVKAIAIVDAVERFWPQKEGEEILKATTENSTRVFVFREREHLKANLTTLQRHAERYNVSALSYTRLAAEYPDYVQDFSIIGGTSTPLLAYYAEFRSPEIGPLPLKVIRFSTAPSELSSYEDVFNGILTIATPIDKSFEVTNEVQADELLDKVFTPEFREFSKRQVEMSAYIEVDQYDAHEEEHAYYQDMMEEMIALFKQYRGDNLLPMRVLELGAGTGIFTKRLADIEKLEITALEIDWACFYLLKRNMSQYEMAMASKGTSLKPENKDSRKYNPPGKFQFAFSSFSDHHIYFLDKEKYLRNVRRNLGRGGIFIVGDEFLPEHDEKDVNARQEALQAYHQHIIAKAKEEGYPVLAKLEEAALESGLRGWGDCKVSCRHYENLVSVSGFDIIHKHKVGPLNGDDIGGVYTYALKKRL